MRCILLILAATLPIHAPSLRAQSPDWTTPIAPFQIADHLYYVGSRDLAAYLITTSAGNILINANLVTSPPQIRASIEALGFKWSDTKILLNSQAHFDHMAGAAQILHETGAKDYVMDGDGDAVRSGGHKDFAFGTAITTDFPPAPVDHILHDNDTVTLGDITLTAHKTAGHTRGCTTWTLRLHVPGEPATQLRTVVIIGGMAALPGYQLVAAPGHPASYLGIAQDFAHTFATLRALPCDIPLGAHGLYFDLLAKLTHLPKEGPQVFIDPTGYQATITAAQKNYEALLTRQQASLRH